MKLVSLACGEGLGCLGMLCSVKGHYAAGLGPEVIPVHALKGSTCHERVFVDRETNQIKRKCLSHTYQSTACSHKDCRWVDHRLKSKESQSL